MADEKTTAPPKPAAPKPEATPESEWVSRAGTILMVVAVAGLAIVLADLALRGRLLGPLFARLPQSSTVEEDGDGPAPQPTTSGE